jgi:hypothetical protein
MLFEFWRMDLSVRKKIIIKLDVFDHPEIAVIQAIPKFTPYAGRFRPDM